MTGSHFFECELLAETLAKTTWIGDGRSQAVTSPLKGHEGYEAIQFLLPSGFLMTAKVIIFVFTSEINHAW